MAHPGDQRSLQIPFIRRSPAGRYQEKRRLCGLCNANLLPRIRLKSRPRVQAATQQSHLFRKI